MIDNLENMPKHVHAYNGYTSVNIGHRHLYSSVTSEVPDIENHYHKYFTVTSTDKDHFHKIEGITGSAIYNPNGSHNHIISSVTSIDGAIPHDHDYYEVTGENVGVKK